MVYIFLFASRSEQTLCTNDPAELGLRAFKDALFVPVSAYAAAVP